MAVRFSADGQDYNRTLALGSQTQLSVTCWMKITTDRNAASTAWSIDNTVSDSYICQTSVSGTTMGIYNETGSTLATAIMTPGAWWFFGFSCNGVNWTITRRAATGVNFSANTGTNGNANTGVQTLILGESAFNGDWLNGALAHFRLWTGVTLTQAQLEQECWSDIPQTATANLRAWYPFWQTDTADYSGSGNTLSGGSGATTEEGPAIGTGLRWPIVVAPPQVTAIDGTGAGTFPALTGTASGALAIAGTGSATFPALQGAASGTTAITGTGTGVFPALTGTASGTLDITGTGAGTFPALTGTAAGTVTIDGTGAGVFPALTGTASGSLGNSGVGAGTFPALTGTAHGDVAIAGSGAGTFPALVGTGSGTVAISGTQAGTFPALLGTATGTLGISAIGAGTFPAFTGTATGTVEGDNTTPGRLVPRDLTQSGPRARQLARQGPVPRAMSGTTVVGSSQ